jgi:hypothetical protein
LLDIFRSAGAAWPRRLIVTVGGHLSFKDSLGWRRGEANNYEWLDKQVMLMGAVWDGIYFVCRVIVIQPLTHGFGRGSKGLVHAHESIQRTRRDNVMGLVDRS